MLLLFCMLRICDFVAGLLKYAASLLDLRGEPSRAGPTVLDNLTPLDDVKLPPGSGSGDLGLATGQWLRSVTAASMMAALLLMACDVAYDLGSANLRH